MNFKEMYPKDKDDTESLTKLLSYSFEELKPISWDLLTCLQDMNWPIAKLVADYLRPHTNALTNEILSIFKSMMIFGSIG